MRRGAGRALLAASVLASGCLRAHRPAPVALDGHWPVYQGSAAGDAFEAERVTDSVPTILWKRDAGRGLSAPPVVNGEVLLAATTNRMVMALSASNGDVYWEHRKHGAFEAPPIVDGDRLFVATGDLEGRAYALRIRDGNEAWEESVPGTAVPLTSDGTRLFVASEVGVTYALRLSDGERVWEATTGPAAAAPVVAEGRVFVSTGADSILALDAETGSVLVRRGLDGSVSAPPAVSDEVLVLPTARGALVALDPATLEEVWRAELGGPVLAAPAIARDGRVYALDRTATVWVVSPGGAAHPLAELGGAATTSMTLTANAVLVGLLDGRFAAVGRAEGDVLWSVDLEDSVWAPAVVRDGTVYVPLRRGELVKLR